MQLKDCDGDMDLCEYTLEDKTLGSHQSVIMCRMYRTEGAHLKWEVEAIGYLGGGSADNYGPLHAQHRETYIQQIDNSKG